MNNNIVASLKQRLDLLTQAKVLDWFWVMLLYNTIINVGSTLYMALFLNLNTQIESSSISLAMKKIQFFFNMTFVNEAILIAYVFNLTIISLFGFFIHRYVGYLLQIMLLIKYIILTIGFTTMLLRLTNTTVYSTTLLSIIMSIVYGLWYIFMLYQVSERVAKQSIM